MQIYTYDILREQRNVQLVGKFWNLHNPQKLSMHQISYKNYKLDFRKIIYVNTNMVGPITMREKLHLKVKFCIRINSPRRRNSPHFTITLITLSKLTQNLKIRAYLMQNFMEPDIKKFSDPKTLTFLGLKISLGQFGPKVFGKRRIQP